MIVGADSWAAADAAIAVDIRQATEMAASVVRYAIASSSCAKLIKPADDGRMRTRSLSGLLHFHVRAA
jgi:hypothetical protein